MVSQLPTVAVVLRKMTSFSFELKRASIIFAVIFDYCLLFIIIISCSTDFFHVRLYSTFFLKTYLSIRAIVLWAIRVNMAMTVMRVIRGYFHESTSIPVINLF